MISFLITLIANFSYVNLEYYAPMKKFGQKIRERRNELGLSQRKLASMVGVTSPTISMWENDTNNPKTENFLNLASALNYSIEELLSDVSIEGMDDETFMGIVKATYPRLSRDKRIALMAALMDLQAEPEK